MRLVGIPAGSDAIAGLFPFLENFATESRGRWTFAGLLRDIESGEKQAWAAVDDGGAVRAAALTEVSIAHTEKWAVLVAGGGRGREDWQHLVDDLIEATRRDGGFAGFEMIARPGWARVFREKMRETHRVLEVRFDHGR